MATPDREAIVREWAKGQETATWDCKRHGANISWVMMADGTRECRERGDYGLCGSVLRRLIVAPEEK